MFGILLVAFIICVIVILLTDKTSPFYMSSLANGVKTSNLSQDNDLYQHYKTKEDAERKAILLMTLYSKPDKHGESIEIYRDDNGSTVLVNHSRRIASTSDFCFDASALNNDTFTYHPAETVYTGVTVGGIHTGGTHTNPAHYTQSQTFSGNALIYLNYAKNLPYFLITSIQLSEELARGAKDIPELRRFLGADGVLTVFGGISELDKAVYKSALSSGNSYSAMAAQSRLTSSAGLPMQQCKAIIKWLNSVTK